MNDVPNTVDVLLTGNTLPDADIDQAAAAFAKLAGISPAQARALISGGKPKVLWIGLSPEKGLAVTARFASMGIDAVMRPSTPAKPAEQERPQQPPTEAQPAQPVPPPPPPKPELPQGSTNSIGMECERKPVTQETPQQPPAEAQPAQPVPPSPPPKPELPPTCTNSIGMEFVLIPAGSFLMGSPEGMGRPEEHPQHLVTISRPFYLGKYPVTQAQWQLIMGNNPSKFRGLTRPVERVSWHDAQQFIAQLNAKEGHNCYRLPTEAEWEYACRAGTVTRYFFGEDSEQLGKRYAWYDLNSDGHTHPVGQKATNPWGLYDMYGNVWEWVEDWYSDQTYYTSSPHDPTGPESGRERVRRGGSWMTGPSFCHSAFRYSTAPSSRENYIGFRLAMTAEEDVQTSIGKLPKAAPASAYVAPEPVSVNTPSAPAAAVSGQPAPQTKAVGRMTGMGWTGAAVSVQPAVTTVSSESEPKDETEYSEEDYYRASIGENLDYYLKKFKILKEKTGFEKINQSCNWAAFFFTSAWLLYRRMYSYFFVYNFILIFGLGLLSLVIKDDNLHKGFALLYAILWGCIANGAYKEHIEKKIKYAREQYKNREDILSFLRQNGGVSIAGCIFGIVFSVIIRFFDLVMHKME